jgi:hypothetical protein
MNKKDTYPVPISFIKEAHDEACSTWKKKIEQECPELFPTPIYKLGGLYYIHYKCGARRVNDAPYLLGRVFDSNVILLSTSDGNRWKESINVTFIHQENDGCGTYISNGDMERVLGGTGRYEAIPA